MSDFKEISECLGARLVDRKISKRTLKALSGVSNQTLVNVFDGTKDYRVSTLLAMLDRLDLKMVLIPKELDVTMKQTAKPTEIASKVSVLLATDKG